MKRISPLLLTLICLLVFAGTAAAADGSSSEPDTIVAWLQLLVFVVSSVIFLKKQWDEQVLNGSMARWQFIVNAVPTVHNIVQKLARLTGNKKLDKAEQFIEEMSKLLRSAGFLEIEPSEVKSVKALGEGYHQDYKAARDSANPLEALGVDPSEAPAQEAA